MFKEPPTVCRVCGRGGTHIVVQTVSFPQAGVSLLTESCQEPLPQPVKTAKTVQTQITAETSQSQLFRRKSISVSSPLYIITVDLESNNQDVIKVQIFSPHLQRLTVTVWMFLDEL